MSYSRIDPGIVGLEQAATGTALLTEPLVRAWDLVTAARLEPIGKMGPERWFSAFRLAAGEAVEAVRAHIAAADDPGSWLRPLARRRDFAATMVEFAHDQERLMDDMRTLNAMAREPAPHGPGLAVRLSEQAVFVEMELARHLNRLGALLSQRAAAERAAGMSLAGGTR
jgi:hypothetical protein